MSGHLLLIATLLTLGLGPLVARLAKARPPLLTLIDGFVLVCIGGLVLLDVIPHALEHGDLLAPVVIVAGYVLPGLAERLLAFGVRQTHLIVLALAMLGIAVHSLLDGSALARSVSLPGSLLGYGVILHQLPVSLMVWWVLSDRHPAVPWAVLAFMAVAIAVGYTTEAAVLATLPERGARLFEAFVGGSLLHVIAHPAHDHDPAHDHEPGHPHEAALHGGGHAHAHAHAHAHDHAHTPERPHDHGHDHGHDHTHAHAHDHGHAHAVPNAWANGVGALLGLLVLVLLVVSRRSDVATTLGQTIAVFWALCLDSAPAVLVAYVAAGLVYAYLPQGSLAWMSRGSRVRQGLAGMAVGLPLPICSCGVVPLYQQLVKQGASTTAAVAFLIATPELGLDAVLLSVPLLGTSYTVVRVAAAAFAAMAVALIMGRLIPRARRGLPLLGEAPAPAAGTKARLTLAVRSGLGEMVDHTAPWILVGLLIAAIASPVLTGSWITALPPGVDVLVFAAVGLPLYVCASASTPLVAVLVAAGVSPGAGLALLLTGPATNVATIGILTRMHGRRFAWLFSGTMIITAVSLGLLVNAVWPGVAQGITTATGEQHGTVWQIVCVMLVMLLYAASVLRRGIRGFLSELRLEGAAA